MTLDVYRGRKTTKQQQPSILLEICSGQNCDERTDGRTVGQSGDYMLILHVKVNRFHIEPHKAKMCLRA